MRGLHGLRNLPSAKGVARLQNSPQPQISAGLRVFKRSKPATPQKTWVARLRLLRRDLLARNWRRQALLAVINNSSLAPKQKGLA